VDVLEILDLGKRAKRFQKWGVGRGSAVLLEMVGGVGAVKIGGEKGKGERGMD
jgi:hypothetical protein